MSILQSYDGTWYAVWDYSNAGFDFLNHFPGAIVSCFNGYYNALQLTV